MIDSYFVNNFNKLAFVDNDGRIKIWDFNRFESYLNESLNGEVHSIDANDSQISASVGNYLYQWDINTGALLETKLVAEEGDVFKISPKFSKIVIKRGFEVFLKSVENNIFSSFEFVQKKIIVFLFGTKNTLFLAQNPH